MITEGYIQLNNGKLQYLRMGNGERLLIAFPGYANEATIFTPFEKYLFGYTIIAVNLPFHGKSIWQEDAPLQKNELVALINELMKEMGVKKCSLAGYSIGAKLCLSITELIPAAVEQLLLIAPDGLVANPLYGFVTRNVIGKWLFKDFLTHPYRYMSLINGLKKINLISAGRYKFSMHYIGNDNDRQFLLKVWPNLRLIIPDRKNLKHIIDKYKIPVHIFIGHRDKVILPAYGQRFSQGLSSVHLHIVEGGHWLFDEQAVSQMSKALLQ